MDPRTEEQQMLFDAMVAALETGPEVPVPVPFSGQGVVPEVVITQDRLDLFGRARAAIQAMDDFAAPTVLSTLQELGNPEVTLAAFRECVGKINEELVVVGGVAHPVPLGMHVHAADVLQTICSVAAYQQLVLPVVTNNYSAFRFAVFALHAGAVEALLQVDPRAVLVFHCCCLRYLLNLQDTQTMGDGVRRVFGLVLAATRALADEGQVSATILAQVLQQAQDKAPSHEFAAELRASFPASVPAATPALEADTAPILDAIGKFLDSRPTAATKIDWVHSCLVPFYKSRSPASAHELLGILKSDGVIDLDIASSLVRALYAQGVYGRNCAIVRVIMRSGLSEARDVEKNGGLFSAMALMRVVPPSGPCDSAFFADVFEEFIQVVTKCDYRSGLLQFFQIVTILTGEPLADFASFGTLFGSMIELVLGTATYERAASHLSVFTQAFRQVTGDPTATWATVKFFEPLACAPFWVRLALRTGPVSTLPFVTDALGPAFDWSRLWRAFPWWSPIRDVVLQDEGNFAVLTYLVQGCAWIRPRDIRMGLAAALAQESLRSVLVLLERWSGATGFMGADEGIPVDRSAYSGFGDKEEEYLASREYVDMVLRNVARFPYRFAANAVHAQNMMDMVLRVGTHSTGTEIPFLFTNDLIQACKIVISTQDVAEVLHVLLGVLLPVVGARVAAMREGLVEHDLVGFGHAADIFVADDRASVLASHDLLPQFVARRTVGEPAHILTEVLHGLVSLCNPADLDEVFRMVAQRHDGAPRQALAIALCNAVVDAGLPVSLAACGQALALLGTMLFPDSGPVFTSWVNAAVGRAEAEGADIAATLGVVLDSVSVRGIVPVVEFYNAMGRAIRDLHLQDRMNCASVLSSVVLNGVDGGEPLDRTLITFGRYRVLRNNWEVVVASCIQRLDQELAAGPGANARMVDHLLMNVIWIMHAAKYDEFQAVLPIPALILACVPDLGAGARRWDEMGIEVSDLGMLEEGTQMMLAFSAHMEHMPAGIRLHYIAALGSVLFAVYACRHHPDMSAVAEQLRQAASAPMSLAAARDMVFMLGTCGSLPRMDPKAQGAVYGAAFTNVIAAAAAEGQRLDEVLRPLFRNMSLCPIPPNNLFYYTLGTVLQRTGVCGTGVGSCAAFDFNAVLQNLILHAAVSRPAPANENLLQCIYYFALTGLVDSHWEDIVHACIRRLETVVRDVPMDRALASVLLAAITLVANPIGSKHWANMRIPFTNPDTLQGALGVLISLGSRLGAPLEFSNAVHALQVTRGIAPLPPLSPR